MISAMRPVARTLAALFLIPLFTQCGSAPPPVTGAVTGPYDSRGNYIEEWVDQPEKWYKPTTPGDKPRPKPKPFIAQKQAPPPTQKPPEIAVVQPRPQVAAPPRPKPTVVKPKTKPKPKVVRYTVRRGDTLSKISRNHGVSLTALRRANGISGDLIRPGQALTIPR